MFIREKIRRSRQRHLFPSQARYTKGSTLIEVLVAMLLLAFTMLGIAGLVGATTRYQLGVEGRSKITLIYNDLTNRVRTNWTQAAAYTYNTASWSAQQAAIPARAKDCGIESCTTVERATDDLWVLRDTVRKALPQGSLLIDGNAANGLTTTFLWFDKDALSPTATDSTVLKQSATCAASMTSVQRYSCCPAIADVGSTPGVRCLNFTFIR